MTWARFSRERARRGSGASSRSAKPWRMRQKQKLVKQLPLTCLLVETDSPVLGPEPGVRNEPANLPLAIRATAEIKSLPEQSVAEAVSENTARLYGALLSIP
jgi:Tat protein secretion system quality control protein TatD with DNase activity